MSRTTGVVVTLILAAVAVWFVRRSSGAAVGTNSQGIPWAELMGGVDFAGVSKPDGKAVTASRPEQTVPAGADDPLSNPAAVYPTQTLSSYQENAPVRSTWTPAELAATHEAEVGAAIDFYQAERAAAMV